MLPLHTETAEKRSVLVNVLVMSKAHAKTMHVLRQHFLLQWQDTARAMARLKPHLSVTATVVSLARAGIATKLGVPMSTVARMAMPKVSAPESVTVCPSAWQC